MPINDALGSRMKENYENRAKMALLRRVPVAIRIDGKAFHTFTKGFVRPFDDVLISSMHETMKYLCENIQGCVLGYTQSDEITLILTDYATLETAAWFDYEVQKLCSVSASMATMAFNRFFTQNAYLYENMDSQFMEAHYKACNRGAMFDARCFNVPKEEVTNLIYWRQLDAARNSVQMVARANFSHSELQNLSCRMLQDKLLNEKGINWNNLPTYQKRGACCVKGDCGWVIDLDIPEFKGEGRDYIECLIREDVKTGE